MITGKRRLIAFTMAMGSILTIELANPIDGGGMSMYGHLALLGTTIAYFGGVAADKYKNGKGEK